MTSLLNYAVFLAMGAVVIVLIFGIVNMMRGGSANRSQTLMRWRVLLQLAAILLLVLVLLIRQYY